MLFALLNKSKLLGLFDDYDTCTNMLIGLSLNGFVKENDMEIAAYESNSIKLVKPADVFCSDTEESSTDNETTDNETTESENDLNNNVINTFETKENKEKRLRNEKRTRKREYNLNLLKKRKEKLEEQKRTFKIDIELYSKFKEFKNTNENFTIPEMFEKKYMIMETLENNNSLDSDTFYQMYDKEDMDNSWSSLFSGNTKDRELLEVSSDE
jgi:hypothetical protein